MSHELPSVLVIGPLPPPVGGIATWLETLLGSRLAEACELEVLDTSPPLRGGVSGLSRFRFDRAFAAGLLLLRCARRLRRSRPQLVHVHTSYYWAFLRDGAMLWLASLFGARTLLQLHGGDFPDFVQRSPRLLQRFVLATLRRCDLVLAITGETERFLLERLPREQVRYLPNFVALPPPPAARTAAASEAAVVHILFVGWVLEAKGVRELLHAAAALPDARFTLAGPVDPRFEPAIRGELEALGERVRLLGACEPNRIAELYASADIFVLPSHREGFPLVLLEAMAASLPVVTTLVGAVPDVVRDGEEGLLVPVRDAAALTEALRALIGDSERRRSMGRRARQRVEAQFTVDKVIADLEDIYRSVARRSSTAR